MLYYLAEIERENRGGPKGKRLCPRHHVIPRTRQMKTAAKKSMVMIYTQDTINRW